MGAIPVLPNNKNKNRNDRRKENAMARKPQITRTITSTTVTVLMVDTESAELQNHTFGVAGKLDEKSALKRAKKDYETDDLKVVKVVALDTTSKLYAMDEATFIANAQCIGDGRIPKNQ